MDVTQLDVALTDFKSALDQSVTDQTSLTTASNNLTTAQAAVAAAQGVVNTDMAGLQTKLDAINAMAFALGFKITVPSTPGA